MITFITQPTYLPWIGIFKAIDYCDNYVFYDDVQLVRKSWQSRNRIQNKSTANPIYLTVPLKKQPRETLIKDIEISDVNFYHDHLKKITANYKKNSFFAPTIDVLQAVFQKQHHLLSDLNIGLTVALADYIGLITNFSRSQDYQIEGDKYSRPLTFAKKLQTTEYVTQVGTKEYTDVHKFATNGMPVTFLNFEHPKYEQYGQNFVPYLSIIDALLNIGPVETKKMIQNIKLLELTS